ncbi:hypothetical protein PN498_22315 [Oscillatoria sp. CS-180]|uniref:hypothetical protein n=1 Tax=Oscillatoria sp. CS-180 TaxID=3021720 RepID=UPI00232B0651|nr:hypothetical protein [Oscillatoria sp. CS-180]MDB9528743.1 hypothetical protein [Oscillatoria sp. CS-180]
MSEGNVPSYPNASNPADPTAGDQRVVTNVSSDSSASGDWEVVPRSGLPPLGTEVETEDLPSAHLSSGQQDAQLRNHIRGLRRSNQSLTERVKRLEEALEQSQQALQQEVERSQRVSQEEKVAAAQSHSTAQLLSELEQSNAALERQTILAETLQAQLQTFQERNQQLEKECTMLRRQQTERQQQLQTAEEACSDLRSRLQRQQRYTLQFKAALEKCLDTSAFKHASRSIENKVAAESSPSTDTAAALNPLVMPRSQRIQPWSANEGAAQADPQLLSLVRSHPEPVISSEAVTDSDALQLDSPQTGDSEPIVTLIPKSPQSEDAKAINHNREAEDQLWQDVERVVDNAASSSSSPPSTASSTTDSETPAQTAAFTEPIPWGTPVQKEIPMRPEETVAVEPQGEAVAKQQPSSRETDFTEPPRQDSDNARPTADKPFQPSSFPASIPALEGMGTTQNSPSPIVHPLKPKRRKRQSLSAVELPSFPPLPKVEN